MQCEGSRRMAVCSCVADMVSQGVWVVPAASVALSSSAFGPLVGFKEVLGVLLSLVSICVRDRLHVRLLPMLCRRRCCCYVRFCQPLEPGGLKFWRLVVSLLSSCVQDRVPAGG
jgi:hypothetical protein